jgi:ATP-dependent DNA helicase RecQ
MAEVPLRDAEIHQASRQLSQILETFDAEQLPQLLQVAVDKGAVPGLYAKVSSTLERDATNLAALYLAGALAIRQEQFMDLGFEQLSFCYQEAKRQGLHTAGIQLIYQEAKAVTLFLYKLNGF